MDTEYRLFLLYFSIYVSEYKAYAFAKPKDAELIDRHRPVYNYFINSALSLEKFSGIKAEFSRLEIIGISAVAMVCAAKRSVLCVEEAVVSNANHLAASF